MYDLSEGSDTGREWVEVFNTGSTAVTLTEWKVFEANVNHTITEFQGGAILSSGSYAVIADNPAKFLIDNPGYTGLLFDSAFSLSNVGEGLALRNGDGVDQDSVTYDAVSGAAGDGKTLQRTANTASFAALLPTPGTGSLVASPATSDTGSSGSAPPTSDGSATSSPGGIFYYAEPQIFAYAGKDRYALVGADILFEAKALSKDGTLLEGAHVSYVWNFGDGATSDQQTVSHHFTHPGTYAVVLDVASGKYAGSHRVFVTVEPAQLTLARLDDGGVRIANSSPRDIDVSFWHLKSGEVFFTLPKHTILLARGALQLRNDVMKLPGGEVTLLYPNGMTVDIAGTQLPTEPKKEVMVVTLPKELEPQDVESALQEDIVTEDVAPKYVQNTETDTEANATATPMGQVAAVGAVASGSVAPWVVGLLGIVGIAILGMMMALAPNTAQQVSEPQDIDGEDELAGWTITEVKR